MMCIMDLSQLRKNIDEIDDRIFDLLVQRVQNSLAVKRLGKQTKGALRPEREAVIVDRLMAKNNTDLPDVSVRAIYTEIVSACRNLQIDRKICVATLGPKGTYSQEAVHHLFGVQTELNLTQAMLDAAHLVEDGMADVAVLPIENSSEGAVRDTHDILLNTNLLISSEIWLPIEHSLLSQTKDLAKINKVYGHPQALGQCRHWLLTNLQNVEQVSCRSSASAAQFAAIEPTSAAIASSFAAKIYKIPIQKQCINDRRSNQTRFVGLSTARTKRTGHDKTSMIVTVRDKPGALIDILQILKQKNLNMTRMESQPHPEEQYAFFIDLEGHIEDKLVSVAFDQIADIAQSVKHLGSFRMANRYTRL